MEGIEIYLTSHDFSEPRRVFEGKLDSLLINRPVFIQFKAIVVYIGDVTAIVCGVEKRKWVSGVTATWVKRRG